jgi:hypothetical protein
VAGGERSEPAKVRPRGIGEREREFAGERREKGFLFRKP